MNYIIIILLIFFQLFSFGKLEDNVIALIGGYTPDSNYIDVWGGNYSCDLDSIKNLGYSTVGGLIDSKITICGGNNTCYQLDPLLNLWMDFPEMVGADSRFDCGYVMTPNGLFVTGGFFGCATNSAEYYNDSKWIPLPNETYPSYGSCMTQLNDTHTLHIGKIIIVKKAKIIYDFRIILTGGYQNVQCNSTNIVSNQIHIFDWTNQEWSEAEPMYYNRSSPMCATLPDGKVIVTGGQNQTFGILNSTEIYDPIKNGWAFSTDLPFPIFNGQLVNHTHSNGTSALYLVNGWTNFTAKITLKSILHFNYSSDNNVSSKWFEVGQLQNGRSGAVILSIPKTSLPNCVPRTTPCLEDFISFQ